MPIFLPEAHYKIYSKIEPKTIKWAQHLNVRQFQPFDFHFQQDLIFRGEISLQIKSEFNFQMISGAKI